MSNPASQPLRALVVTQLYPCGDDPQAGIFIHRQLLNLAAQGICPHVLLYRPAPPRFPLWLMRRSWLKHFYRQLFWQKTVEGIPVSLVYYPRAWKADEDVVPAIGAALTDYVRAHSELQNFDLIYAHFLWTSGAAALQMGRELNLPVAAIARGSEMHAWQKTRPRCRAWVERVIREADCVLANCEDLRARADAFVPGSVARIEVVYNGCDAESFKPATDKRAVRRALGLNAADKILLFCGSLDTRKGIAELTEAWRAFAATHTDWQLVAVGRAGEKELAARLKALPRVRLTGQVSAGKVLTYLQAADAYVQPSRLEGLANATMEAMAVGLPVITTRTCGQTELIENNVNGWLVEPQNPAELLSALNALAADETRAAHLGRAARRTILERFNPQSEAARLAGILRAVARPDKVGTLGADALAEPEFAVLRQTR